MIIGTTGTLGAGKNTINDYLVKKFNFINFTCSDEIREELKKRNLEDNRDNLIRVANELREIEGNGFIGKRIAKKIIDQNIKKASIDGIRHPDEVIELKKAGNFFLIKVDAPIKVRFERIKSRGTLKDEVTIEKFREQEEFELKSKNKYNQQIAATMVLADYSINNDSTKEELYNKVEEILKKIK